MSEIKLSSKRCEEIKRAVVNMFVHYGVSCLPINGFEIASKMGVRIIPYSAFVLSTRRLLLKKSEDGFSLQRDSGEWIIYYNDAKRYRRINNTIMHEIGHIVLDHTEDSQLAEKEVNFFAKYALVPPVLVHKLKIDSPGEIVKFFEVSFEAADYALKYYRKWLEFGHADYTRYERTLLTLFKNVG